ncbi:DUF6232 family protein [Oscillatoria salina]|uniref:DUF6232 family protein n=1 Tax=Oscillatoria salina TaxID=331517 RepID=UPI0013BBDF89|nr:DUF6232 family protein [Oscillatoria salina]MBZ8179746.1 hypothetical protein [Oscillatoria salina IIICB1]NET87151.1 hypothetical protein [Kamptonema sp. SIO1D9]
MADSIFYDNGVVRVTRNMFEVPSTQFPIRNIAAVKTLIENPSRKGPIICIVLGVFLLIFYGLGLLLIGLGIWWWRSQKSTYWIVVVSGGSESRAYASTDFKQIREIQSAVNSALSQH